MIGQFNIVVAMKPLDGNFAQNALKHGVAGLNIQDTRVGTDKITINGKSNDKMFGGNFSGGHTTDRTGRYPSNVIHDGCLQSKFWHNISA